MNARFGGRSGMVPGTNGLGFKREEEGSENAIEPQTKNFNNYKL